MVLSMNSDPYALRVIEVINGVMFGCVEEELKTVVFWKKKED